MLGVDRLDGSVSTRFSAGWTLGQRTWGEDLMLSGGSKAHDVDSLSYNENEQHAGKCGKYNCRKSEFSRFRETVKEFFIFINGMCVRER